MIARNAGKKGEIMSGLSFCICLLFFPVMSYVWAMRRNLPLMILLLSHEETRITTFVPKNQRVGFQKRLK